MNKLKNFLVNKILNLKNYFSLSFGLLFSRIIGGILTILIARTLGNAEFGAFSAGFFIMTILGMCTTGIDRAFVFNFVQKKEENIIADYLFLKLIIIGSFILISTISFIILRDYLYFNLLYSIMGAILSLSFWVLTFISSLYQAEKNFTLYGITHFIYYLIVLSMILIANSLNLTHGKIYLVIYLLSSFILILFLLPKRKIEISFSLKGIKTLLSKSKWLFLSELVWLIFIRLDYFTVSKFLTPEELGNYALALRIINILIIFINSLSLYILPKVAEIDSEMKLKKYWKVSYSIGISLLFISALLFFTMGKIIDLFFGRDYVPALRFFRIMLISYIPMIFIPPFKFLILRYNKKIHYFTFTFIMLLSYTVTFKPLEYIFKSYAPIISKGIGFLLSLFFGIILYIFSDKSN